MATLTTAPQMILSGKKALDNGRVTVSPSAPTVGTVTSAVAGGNASFAWSGTEACQFDLDATASGQWIRYFIDLSDPADQLDLSSRLFLMRFGFPGVDPSALQQKCGIHIYVSNDVDPDSGTTLPTNYAKSADPIFNAAFKVRQTTVCISDSNLSTTGGSGVDWDSPIKLLIIELRKTGSAGVIQCFLDGLFANWAWENDTIPVYFSWDDNEITQHTYVYPAFRDAGFGASIQINPEDLGGGKLTEALMQEMTADWPGVAFNSHSDDHADLALETLEDQRTKLQSAIDSLNSWTDVRVSHDMISYPFGSYNEDTETVLVEKEYLCARGANQGNANMDQYHTDIGMFEVGPTARWFISASSMGTSGAACDGAAEVLARVDQMIAKKMPLSLFGHVVTDSPSGSREISITDLDTIVAGLQARNVDVVGLHTIYETTSLATAIDYPVRWWLRHITTSEINLCVRVSETCSIAVTLGNETQTVAHTYSASVNHGVELFTFTGLQANREYAVTITKDSAAYGTGKVRTASAEGSGNFTFAWASCTQRNAAGANIASLQRYFPKVRAMFVIGDAPYTNSTGDFWNVNASQSTGDAPEDVSAIAQHHLQEYSRTYWQMLMQQIPVYRMWDDHELGGEDWDHSITQANAGGAAGIGAVSQADVDAHFDAARTACEIYWQGHPANTNVLAVAEKPNEADAGTPASQYPPLYYDFVRESVHFIVVDNISYKNAVTDTDDASKTCLGANQKAWLKDVLATSTSTFKVILSSKKLWKSTVDNADTYDQYQTERSEIVDYIDDAVNGGNPDAWAVPGGCAVLAGDRNTPDVGYVSATPLLCVNACPVEAAVDAGGGGAGYATGIVYKAGGDAGTAADSKHCYGVVEVNGNASMDIHIVAATGIRLWTGRVLPGSNALTSADNGAITRVAAL